MAHPRHRWDEAFQTPVRFSLMAALGRTTGIEFRTLRDLLEANDSVLSKAVSYLDRAGYIKVTKQYAGPRPSTWIEPTTAGHRAYTDHLEALRAIAAGDDRAVPGHQAVPPHPK